jgi:methylase of polypeptide subunit release factors
MTQLLEQAMTEVQKLPEHEQNVIASLIFEEMLDERKWDEAFANSQDQLSKLADEALSETKQGKSTPLQFS